MGVGAWLDSIIGIVSPESQLRRGLVREQLRKMKAGEVNRLRPFPGQRLAPDPRDSASLQRARWNAYQLYLDNSTVRRLVGAYVAQVVGSGPVPKSLATNRAGEPLPVVRKELVRVWDRIKDGLRYARSPGAGAAGLHADMQAACREIVLAGEFLIYHRNLSEDQQAAGNYPVPYAYEIITANRLVMDSDTFIRSKGVESGNDLFRGIEFDSAGRRVAYHVYERDPADSREYSTRTIRIPARDVTHVYKEERPGQERGYSMLSPAISMLTHLGEFLEQELISARVQNSVSLIIHSRSGKVGQNLLPAGTSDGTDDNGSVKRFLEPGAIMNLGSKDTEGVTPFLPNRAAGNPDPLVGIFMRAVAAAVPGIKASSITGDYRASSYSSEKAADNDLWREVEQEQSWFYRLAYQSIWERAMEAAIIDGLITGVSSEVDGRSIRYRSSTMLDVEWHGPYPKSIDPNKDAEAAKALIGTHLSTFEAEAAAIGMDAAANLASNAEFTKEIIRLGLTPPEELVAPEPPEPDDTEEGADAEDDA